MGPSRPPPEVAGSSGQWATVDGADWAYAAGIISIILGGSVVLFLFPRRDEEKRLLAEYHAEDTSVAPEEAALDGA